jgi:hypothetical protein
MAENAWEVTLLNLGQEETAVLRLSDAGVSIAQHVIPLRQLRSWDHEAESNVITLRLLSGAEPATVCFRTADATEICTRIGERSLAEVRAARVAAAPSEAESPRGAVLPAQLGGRPAELHVVDAGVKLIVDQELVRFIAFTEIRSWNDNPQSSTLSIVTRDHRTLEIGCESSRQAAESIADSCLAVARAIFLSSQSPQPQSSATPPEGVPVKPIVTEETLPLERGVRTTIREDADEEQETDADGEAAAAAEHEEALERERQKLKAQAQEQEQAAAAMAATYEAKAAELRATVADAQAAAEESARQHAAAEQAIAEEKQRLEAIRSEAAAAAEKQSEEMQAAIAQAAETAALQAKAEAEAASKAQVEALEAKYSLLLEGQASASTSADQKAVAEAASRAQVEAMEAKYQALLSEHAAGATSAEQKAEADAASKAQMDAIEAKYQALLTQQAADATAANRSATAVEIQAASKAQVQAIEAKYEALLAEQASATAAAQTAAATAAAAAAAANAARAAPALSPETPVAAALADRGKDVHRRIDTGEGDSDSEDSDGSPVASKRRSTRPTRSGSATRPATAPPPETWPVAPKQLRNAARNGALSVVQQHVVSGAWANSLMSRPTVSADGSSHKVGAGLLYSASQRGHAAVVQHLLAEGADPNASSSSGSTPLYTAVYNNHEEVAKALLAAGANPHLPKDDGWTPLTLARTQNTTKAGRSMLVLLEHAASTLAGEGEDGNDSDGSSITSDDEVAASRGDGDKISATAKPMMASGAPGRTSPREFSPSPPPTAFSRSNHSSRRSSSSYSPGTASVAVPLSSELETLATLRLEGLLSESEFSDAKAAIINSSLAASPRAAAGGSTSAMSSGDGVWLQHEHERESSTMVKPSPSGSSGDRRSAHRQLRTEESTVVAEQASSGAGSDSDWLLVESAEAAAAGAEPKHRGEEQVDLDKEGQALVATEQEESEEAEDDGLQAIVAQHRAVLAEAQRSGGSSFKTGRMEDALKEFATAIGAIRELMILSESASSLSVTDGEMLSTDGAWDDESREQESLVLRSTLLDVLEIRAIAHYNLHDFESALRDAMHCITLDSSRLAGYMRAARALQKLGRVEEAKQYMLAATQAEDGENPGEALD